jgi:hypothetical protein
VIGTTAADISSDTMRNNVTSAGGAMLNACPIAHEPIEGSVPAEGEMTP